MSRTGRLLPGDVQPVQPGCQAPSLPSTLRYISHTCLFSHFNTLQGWKRIEVKDAHICFQPLQRVGITAPTLRTLPNVSLHFGISPGLLHTDTYEETAKHSQMQSSAI